jgi:hypothetical protein
VNVDETYDGPTEQQKIDGWRLHVLIEAGYPVAIAEKLATDTRVDLHQAVELVERGCRPAIAALILL